MFDPYKVLEVNNRAGQVVIKAAYQALMKKAHPDHNGDEDLSKSLNAAYEILSNSKKRKEYDLISQDKSGTIIGNYRVIEAIAEGGEVQWYITDKSTPIIQDLIPFADKFAQRAYKMRAFL